MKSLLILLATICAVSAQTVFSNKLFTLAFDYPLSDVTNAIFRAHSSTNITVPVTNWDVVETGWNLESTNTDTVTLTSSNKLLATVPVTWFIVSASNEWGIAFSDALMTVPPRQGNRLRLR